MYDYTIVLMHVAIRDLSDGSIPQTIIMPTDALRLAIDFIVLFTSASFTARNAQRNYTVDEKDLLSVVETLQEYYNFSVCPTSVSIQLTNTTFSRFQTHCVLRARGNVIGGLQCSVPIHKRRIYSLVLPSLF
jgi:hypothetical protein